MLQIRQLIGQRESHSRFPEKYNQEIRKITILFYGPALLDMDFVLDWIDRQKIS